MSFTDQKPRLATEADIKGRWSGAKDGTRFRCYLCGHRFAVGDHWRFVIQPSGGNTLVCATCDGTNQEVQKRWADLHAQWKALKQGAFWSFCDTLESQVDDAQQDAREANREYGYLLSERRAFRW